MTQLVRAQRGAAMIFGICFAVFLLAMVYYLVGIGETLLFRERVQDAADTAAFSAAVVNARGMNLIALINLVMAVVLSIFVGLRLAQTLCYAGILICGALAYPTYGASLSAIAPLSQAAQNIAKAADNYKKPMKQVLSALHTAGKATSVVVPWGSNLRVIDQTATYGAFGVAMPSRVTLPVEDDEFSVLCNHAGSFVGKVSLLPLAPILPSFLEEKLEKAAGNIVEAGSGWFCDGEGEPPDLNGDEDTQLVELPRFPSQDECDKKIEAGARGGRADGKIEGGACTRAAVERLASMPNRQGQARQGEPVCPQNCQHSNRVECPPKQVPDCEPEQVLSVEAEARDVLGYTRVTGGKSSPYGRRLSLAREQCKPESEHGRDDLVGFWWLERTRTRSYHWHDALRTWVEDESVVVASPERLVEGEDDDFPCGKGGVVAETYEHDSTKPVCEGQLVCQTRGLSFGNGACLRTPPAHGGGNRFEETSTEVLAILRCAYETDVPNVETPEMDINDEVGDGEGDEGKEGKQEQNINPFRLQEDVCLGGSDFQLRAVVYDGDVPTAAQGVVEMSKWSAPTDADETEETASAVATVFAAMGRVALGQAEYYFDWTGIGGELDDETDDGDRTEWLWNLGWRARMRPFRVRHSLADAERAEKKDSPDAEQSKFMPEEAKAQKVDAIDCDGLGDGCSQAQQVIDVFGEGDDEEE